MSLKKKLFWCCLVLGGIGIIGSLFSIFYNLPDANPQSYILNTPSIRITDRNNQPLYEILPDQGGRHAVVSLQDIPDCMKKATIAVEDNSFYSNPGIDPLGIVRALWINIQGGETIAGGSTITQQVARNLLLSQGERTERSLRRKLREAVLALELTKKLSKDEILALYLNQTYYGGLAYGLEAASQTYFGKPANKLVLPECALLAGLPQAPGLYDPYTNPNLASQRKDVVLGLMEKFGFITSIEHSQAREILLKYNPSPYPIQAPHFVWIVKGQLDQLISSGRIASNQSLVVRTSLDLADQKLAEAAIAKQLASFKEPIGGLSKNVNNAALVALDARSGDILALVGSANYFDSTIDGAVDMATSPRQTGSVFKPIIYASAMDPALSSPWTAATTLMDISTTFTTQDGQPYQPTDYDEKEHGPVSIRTALGSSLNIPAVLTLDHIGIDKVISQAKSLGITTLGSPDKYDLSLALGGGEMSLLELTSAFGAFANIGIYTGNYAILDVHDPSGNLLYTQEKEKPVQIIDPHVAWLVDNILSDDEARQIGFGLNSTLKIDRTAAVKTGTTTNFDDNWTIGFTPDLVVGVWVGNSDYQAMRDVTGLTGAAPIWNEFTREVLQGVPNQDFPQPEGLVQVRVCDISGLLPTPACPKTHLEWFIDGTQPKQNDNTYQEVWVDTSTGLLANDATPMELRQSMVVLDLPVQTLPWARSIGLPLLADVMQGQTDQASSGADLLTLLTPQSGMTYLIDPRFDQSAQQLQMEAVAGHGLSKVTFWVDDVQVADFSAPPYQWWWPLKIGTHLFRVQAISQDGKTVTSSTAEITVLMRNP
jgi:penicillin-binding protein 1C